VIAVGRRAAAFVTLAYLVLTLPLLARAEWTLQRVVVAVLHATAMAALAWSLRAASADVEESPASHPLRRVLADWLPLLVVPFLYGELPYLMGGGVLYHDALVQRWEAALFGGQPARTLASSMPSVALSEILHLGYVLYYPIVYVPPLLLYLPECRPGFSRMVLAVMLTYAVCFVIFVLFPVEGPRYAWGPPPGVPSGPIRSLTLAILERGSSRGTAFPSSHAAVAVAQSVVALRYQRRVGMVVSLTTVLLIVGAVYGGFHYAIDMLVGAVLGIVVALGVLLARRGASNRRADSHLRHLQPLSNFTRP
jgi:membrane-associated phospholipid phosphatase